MKKIILCFLVVFASSCSSGDDSNLGSDEDPIIGVWKPVADGEVYNGVPDDYIYNDCEQRSRYTFSANGDFKALDYDNVYDNSSNIIGCEQSDIITTGTWLRLNENQIKLTFEGEVSIPDRTRFLDNNTFRIEWDNGNYIEFKKVS